MKDYEVSVNNLVARKKYIYKVQSDNTRLLYFAGTCSKTSLRAILSSSAYP